MIYWSFAYRDISIVIHGFIPACCLSAVRNIKIDLKISTYCRILLSRSMVWLKYGLGSLLLKLFLIYEQGPTLFLLKATKTKILIESRVNAHLNSFSFDGLKAYLICWTF